MSSRELLVLGTSSQVPTRHRNHNGYLLLWDGLGLLFDPGEGTQRQMTMCGARTHQIHRILITHFHGDHCLGLPGILQRISLDGVPHEVGVHYPLSGERYFERLRRASIYEDHAHVTPFPHDQPGTIGQLGRLTLSAARLDHGVDTWGYRVQEDDGWTLDPRRLAAVGLRGPAIGELARAGEIHHGGRTITLPEVANPRPGQAMAFLMDTRPCPSALQLASGVDLLVCESTYLDAEAHLADEHRHMTAGQAGQLAAEAGARRLVLTHFSQRHPDNSTFVAEAQRHHADVVAATDLAHIAVPTRAPPP